MICFVNEVITVNIQFSIFFFFFDKALTPVTVKGKMRCQFPVKLVKTMLLVMMGIGMIIMMIIMLTVITRPISYFRGDRKVFRQYKKIR